MKKIFHSKKAMVSTQRLALITIVLNVVIGLIATFYMSTQFTSFENLETQIEIQDAVGEGVEDHIDPVTITTTQDTLTENTMGDSVGLGDVIWNIFKKGLVPLTLWYGTDRNSTVEDIIAIILELFRGWMYVLLAIEIYFVFKNKKTS